MQRIWLVSAALLAATACTDNTAPDPVGAPAEPSAISGPTAQTELSFVQISGGRSHSCGRTMAGKLYCWGQGGDGQLGNGTLNNKKRPTPVNSTLTFTWVSAAYNHTCAIATGGSAYCWGDNYYGQLGDGSNTDRWSPKLVSGGLTYKQIEAGGIYSDHTCALTTAGKIYCWGYNGSGQLGNGSAGYYTSTSYPTATYNIGVTWRQLAAGGYHTCAVSTADKAYCWGEAGSGQTGTGGIYYIPTAVTGGLAFRQVSAGDYHTCGTTTANKAYCWGAGTSGALGTGTTNNQYAPKAVFTTIAFTRVFAGVSHSCGITTKQQGYCWGTNTSGQLGDGTTTRRLAPVPIKATLALSQIGTHGDHTCAVTATVGVGYCWGANGSGQLGDGTNTNRLVPTKVAAAP